jgi:hypothetical protein
VTFAGNGTYSSVADLGGLTLTALYAPVWAGGAGSVTLRADWDAAGTGFPLRDVAGAVIRVTSFAAGTYYALPNGTFDGVQYARVEVGTAGTLAAGTVGTIILVGRA